MIKGNFAFITRDMKQKLTVAEKTRASRNSVNKRSFHIHHDSMEI